MSNPMIRTLLESALEHASHAWKEVEKDVERLRWSGWPPQVPHSQSGTPPYHLAAMIAKVYEAYNLMGEHDDLEHTNERT